MKIFYIDIRNKVATFSLRDGELVCGNDDYAIRFNFDAPWAPYNTKTARFVWNGKFLDVPFSGDTCAVPVIYGATLLEVGAYVDDDIRTTTPARIPCLPSIRCKTSVTEAGGGDDDGEVNIQPLAITANGTYRASGDVDGYSPITVAVPQQIPDGYIKPNGTKTITDNGTHDVSAYKNAKVEVPVSSAYIIPRTFTENGTYYAEGNADGFAPITVAVPEPSGTKTITENGTHDVRGFANVVVSVESGGGGSNVRTLKGTITFKDGIYNEPLSMGESITQDIAFTSGGSDYKQFKVTATSMDELPEVLYYYQPNGGMYTTASSAGSGHWDMEAYKTITILGEAVVSEEFYNWVMANSVSDGDNVGFSVDGYSESYTVPAGTTWGEFVDANSTPFGIGEDYAITFMGSSRVFYRNEVNGDGGLVYASDVITDALIYYISDN